MSLVFLAVSASMASSAYAANKVDVFNLINTTASNNIQNIISAEKGSEFRVSKEISLGKLGTKQRLQQYFYGIPVFGYSVSASKSNMGFYSQIQGSILANIAKPESFVKAKITSEQALDISMKKTAKKNLKSDVNNPKSDMWIPDQHRITSCCGASGMTTSEFSASKHPSGPQGGRRRRGPPRLQSWPCR